MFVKGPKGEIALNPFVVGFGTCMFVKGPKD